MPNLRMTTRRWMIAVAALAPLLAAVDWAGRMRQRRAWCLRKAAEHAASARASRRNADIFIQIAERQLLQAVADIEAGPQEGAQAEYFVTIMKERWAALESALKRDRWAVAPEWWQRAAYHNRLRRDYLRAADRPWLPPPPDPSPFRTFQRPGTYEELADSHAGQAEWLRDRAASLDRRIARGKEGRDPRVPRWERELLSYREIASYNEEVSRLYREAARYPMRPPPKLPPRPEDP